MTLFNAKLNKRYPGKKDRLESGGFRTRLRFCFLTLGSPRTNRKAMVLRTTVWLTALLSILLKRVNFYCGCKTLCFGGYSSEGGRLFHFYHEVLMTWPFWFLLRFHFSVQKRWNKRSQFGHWLFCSASRLCLFAFLPQRIHWVACQQHFINLSFLSRPETESFVSSVFPCLTEQNDHFKDTQKVTAAWFWVLSLKLANFLLKYL